ncbi:hypothetical protein KAU33_07340 [Candidatus Dependentiae bacterium]|nr:hypothetical protein [Candidatus Dependentiae bacterium]
MPFQNESQEKTFNKVKEALFNEYGQRRFAVLKNPAGEEVGFGMYVGSADIKVHVHPYREKFSTISISAVLTFQTQADAKLFEWIVKQNYNIMYGGFCYIEYKEKPGWGNVVFYYDIYGETFSEIELYNAVDNASWVADKWDDYIVENFGGKTTRMSIEEQQKKEN